MPYHHHPLDVPETAQGTSGISVGNCFLPYATRESWDWRERKDCRIECVTHGSRLAFGRAVEGRPKAVPSLDRVISSRRGFEYAFIRFHREVCYRSDPFGLAYMPKLSGFREVPLELHVGGHLIHPNYSYSSCCYGDCDRQWTLGYHDRTFGRRQRHCLEEVITGPCKEAPLVRRNVPPNQYPSLPWVWVDDEVPWGLRPEHCMVLIKYPMARRLRRTLPS